MLPLPPEPAFPIADEYVKLQSQFEPPGWIAWLLLLNDMIIQPVWAFLSFCMGNPPSKFSLAAMLIRTVDVWRKWVRYQVLRDIARNWVLLTKIAGGPFISCNDPKYHVFVYAEAIERLRALPRRLNRISNVPVAKERLKA